MPRYRLQELGVESTGRFTFIIDAKPYDCQEMDLISVKNDPVGCTDKYTAIIIYSSVDI